jgi:hypothetical protein
MPTIAVPDRPQQERGMPGIAVASAASAAGAWWRPLGRHGRGWAGRARTSRRYLPATARPPAMPTTGRPPPGRRGLISTDPAEPRTASRVSP